MRYKEWNCKLVYDNYYDGNTAIQIIDTDDGLPIATATVNIDGLEHNEVAIKNYSEGEGMLDWLIKNNVVSPPHRFFKSGYVTIPVCFLRDRS